MARALSRLQNLNDSIASADASSRRENDYGQYVAVVIIVISVIIISYWRAIISSKAVRTLVCLSSGISCILLRESIIVMIWRANDMGNAQTALIKRCREEIHGDINCKLQVRHDVSVKDVFHTFKLFSPTYIYFMICT